MDWLMRNWETPLIFILFGKLGRRLNWNFRGLWFLWFTLDLVGQMLIRILSPWWFHRLLRFSIIEQIFIDFMKFGWNEFFPMHLITGVFYFYFGCTLFIILFIGFICFLMVEWFDVADVGINFFTTFIDLEEPWLKILIDDLVSGKKFIKPWDFVGLVVIWWHFNEFVI